MGKGGRPRPAGGRVKKDNYWCVTIFNGQSFGNIVINKHPVDFIQTKALEGAYYTLMSQMKISKEQYDRGMKIAEVYAKKKEAAQKQKMDEIHKEATS